MLLGVAVVIPFLVAGNLLEPAHAGRRARNADNPKSNDDLKRYLRFYPQFREAIIEFTATWRALSIIEKVLPPPIDDPVIERQLIRRAQARYSAIRGRRAGAKKR